MRKIILTGHLRSGKDSVAHRILTTHGYFEKVAFGDALKRLYHELHPWVPENPKPREAYQAYGQDMRRLYGEDIWIRHAERTIDFYRRVKRPDGIVISDLRQLNEYEWARKNGYTIIRVTAPLEIRKARAIAAGDSFNEKDLEHETERHIEGFDVDYELINDGTLDDLYTKVDELMEAIQ